MIKPKFVFHWFARGTDHRFEIEAKTYGEACWLLGQVMATEFLSIGVPNDFLMKLDDEQACLGAGSAESVITRKEVPIAG